MSRYNGESVGFNYAFRDLLISLLIVFMALSTLALLAAVKSNQTTGITQGSLVITMHWDAAASSDVDLWVKPPNSRVVGFSSTQGSNCSLLRDDLGHPTAGSENEEMIVCRNPEAGEWIVNNMFFLSRDGKRPVEVKTEVFMVQSATTQLVSQTIMLQYPGDQQTAFRFSLNDNKALIPGSVNHIPQMLYNTNR